jgi:hypothetical protein
MKELEKAIEEFGVAFENYQESQKKVFKVVEKSLMNITISRPITYIDSDKESYGIDK